MSCTVALPNVFSEDQGVVKIKQSVVKLYSKKTLEDCCPRGNIKLLED